MHDKNIENFIKDSINKIEETNIMESVSKTKEMLIDIKNSLDTISIVIQYLKFDLEATKRERDELRMKLEDME